MYCMYKKGLAGLKILRVWFFCYVFLKEGGVNKIWLVCLLKCLLWTIFSVWKLNSDLQSILCSGRDLPVSLSFFSVWITLPKYVIGSCSAFSRMKFSYSSPYNSGYTLGKPKQGSILSWDTPRKQRLEASEVRFFSHLFEIANTNSS